MEMKRKILVVEDDEALSLGLTENLKFSGYEVVCAATGPDALKAAMEGKPDLVLLDLMLPGMSGYEVCRKMREGGVNVPVIMLTARQDEFDKVHGFESGADDYVTKPFSVRELLARIGAVLRRSEGLKTGPKEIRFGDCVLDTNARTLLRRKPEHKARRGRAEEKPAEEWEEVKLTRTEFDLLAYFGRNEGRAVSREEAMNEVWGLEYYGTQRSLDTFVASLRSKIEHEPGEPKHILTVHGVGYKFSKG